MTIAVAGLGYVGMSIAVLLAQHNRVRALDVSAQRVAQVNDRRSPIEDAEITQWLAEKQQLQTFHYLSTVSGGGGRPSG